MIDHGADAANFLMREGPKVIKVSTAVLKTLLILLYKNAKQKTGKANIKRLVNMLNTGERICDVTMPKEKIEKLTEVAKRHGVLFAVAERSKEKDFVVYYPESQSNRMRNALHELATFEGKDLDHYIAQVENKTPDGAAWICFDKENPKDILEMRSEIAEDGKDGTVIYLHQEGKDVQQITLEQSKEVVTEMQWPRTVDIDEIHLEDPQRSDKIRKIAADYIDQIKQEEQEKDAGGETDRKPLAEWKEEVKKVQTLSKEQAKEMQQEVQTQIKAATGKEER